MGQVRVKDKIGALSEGGGTITLQPSILTVGGQQYTTNALNVALPAMAANTRYQIYAVSTVGIISLVISTNENSVGPAGYDAWKLVGSFRANGLTSVAFGAFINIVGIPKSGIIPYLPVFSNLGTVINIQMFYSTFGKLCEVHGKYTMGTGAAAIASMSIPFTLESTTYIPSTTQAGPVMFNNVTSVFCNLLTTAAATVFNYGFTFSGATGGVPINGNSFGAGTIHEPSSNLTPMAELSDTPIEDL